MSVFGDFIKLRREELRLDQADLARRLGVHQQTVSKWEQAKAVPQPERIRRLADALAVEALDLMRYAGYLPEGEPLDNQEEEPFHRFVTHIGLRMSN